MAPRTNPHNLEVNVQQMPLTDIAAEQGAELLTNAEKMEKKPYLQDGGDASNPDEGFDCSGLVWYVISEMGHYKFAYRNTPTLAHHPMLRRLSIPPELLRAGDIVLFSGHVGFYDPAPANGDKTLYSATSHGVHHENPKYWGSPLGYYRLQTVSQ
jgi:cell wall-associated NlpC family hydrolase